jgi:hypothetical protein
MKNLIIMASLLSTLFGCSGQDKKSETINIYPNESFSVLQAELEGKPVIGTINMAYKDYDKKSQYIWCLKITIGLDSLQENGLPQEQESIIAKNLEDELVDSIKKLAVTHYVGHIFYDGFLDVYVYMSDPNKAHKYLQKQIDREGLIRPFGYVINEDKDWKIVQGFMK